MAECLTLSMRYNGGRVQSTQLGLKSLNILAVTWLEGKRFSQIYQVTLGQMYHQNKGNNYNSSITETSRHDLTIKQIFHSNHKQSQTLYL